MDEAAALSKGKPLSFGLSGGEPFLNFKLLLEVVAHGKHLGAVVTCVTNASWATSRERAHKLLSQVRNAGLNGLAISSSRFHDEFIQRSCVETALSVGRELGVHSAVKYVRTRSDERDQAEIEAWATKAGAAEVQEIPLLPHLRNDYPSLPESEYFRGTGLPHGRCPTPMLTIREDGEAFTCCTPGGFSNLLGLGNAHTVKLSELRDRFYTGGTQQILREHGPIFFARAIEAQGLAGRLRKSYTGVCDLCTHIASDPALAAVATTAAEEFEMQRLEGLLRSLR